MAYISPTITNSHLYDMSNARCNNTHIVTRRCTLSLPVYRTMVPESPDDGREKEAEGRQRTMLRRPTRGGRSGGVGRRHLQAEVAEELVRCCLPRRCSTYSPCRDTSCYLYHKIVQIPGLPRISIRMSSTLYSRHAVGMVLKRFIRHKSRFAVNT